MCCACCVPSHAASGKWRAQVDALMKQGEFKKASTLMDKLPKQVKKENEVVIDSLNTIMERIWKDFTMTPADGAELIREKVPGATDAQINQWKNARQIEVMNIDGQEWWFRKSVRNLWLLAPEFKQAQDDDKQESFKARREQFLASMKRDAASNGTRDWHRATITFKLDAAS